ncbi:hypothetical protein [uncultured Sphingomonas sp.]|uniref:hypothetical protein n=1 Tax=uncultured Sphingomonas sp. TaxID=158754 RepID=UPI0035CA04F9
MLASAPVAAQTFQTPIDALAQDAGEYAARYGVLSDQARYRLRALEETVAATDTIAVRFAGRLAGIAVEHSPTFRVVVLLTGTMPVAEERLYAAGIVVPVVYRTGAVATRGQVVAAIERHQAAIRAALPHPPGLGVDQRTGEMVVTLNRADIGGYGHDALVTALTLMTGVPVRLQAVDLPDADSAVDGGARVVGVSPVDGRRYACTTGFVVTNGVQAGVVTAAHCPDALAHIAADRREAPLTFVGQWGWGYQDVQLHLASEPLRPFFHADTARAQVRPVTGTRQLGSTRAGDFTCHRGERSGYSCAEVELTDFAPSGDLCGGACTPTWVTVGGPVCRSGDSGGPVFIGTVAVGLLKGASYDAAGGCNFYYYMSTEYLPEGWSVMRQPVTPLAMAAAPSPR